jgi:hypothetical protein
MNRLKMIKRMMFGRAGGEDIIDGCLVPFAEWDSSGMYAI